MNEYEFDTYDDFDWPEDAELTDDERQAIAAEEWAQAQAEYAAEAFQAAHDWSGDW